MIKYNRKNQFNKGSQKGENEHPQSKSLIQLHFKVLRVYKQKLILSRIEMYKKEIWQVL